MSEEQGHKWVVVTQLFKKGADCRRFAGGLRGSCAAHLHFRLSARGAAPALLDKRLQLARQLDRLDEP